MSKKKHETADSSVETTTEEIEATETETPVDNEIKVTETGTETDEVDEIGVAPNEPIVTILTGVVTDCIKLNVRKEPVADAEIVSEILCNTMVEVNETASTDEFYKVYTPFGVEGYCMKKFINILK